MRNFVIAALAGALIVIISASLPSLAGENAGLQAVAYPIAVALFIPYVCFMLPAVLDGGREMTALYALFAALSILTVFYIAESSARGYGRMRLLVLEGALVCMMSLSFAVFMISLGITNTAILSFPIAIAVLIYILAALVEIVPPEGVGAESNANEAPTSSNHIEYIPEPEESPVSEEVPEAIDYSDIILLDAEDTGESYGAIVVDDEDESPAYEAIAVSEDDDNEAITAIDKSSSISDDVITAAQINQNDEEIEEEAIVVDEDSVIEEKALSFETVETEEIPAIAIDSEDELAAIQAISLDNTESISTASVSSFFSDDTEEVNALLIDEAEETSVDAILVDVEGSEDLPAIIKEEDKPEELPVSVVEESEDEVLPVAVIDAEEDTVVPVIVDSAEESQMLIIEEEDIPETEPATQLPDEVYEEIAVDAEETSAVPAPPVLSVSTSLSVPTAPSITNTAHLSAPSAPVLTNTAELVEEVYQPVRADMFEDDFWSTFYIAGQDTLQLEDGEYFMDLLVNDVYVGVISTMIVDGKASLNSSELSGYLSDTLTDAAKDRIFIDDSRYVALDSLEASGVRTSFNSDTFEVRLTFNPEDMPIQILSIRGLARRSSSRPISGAIDLDPVTFMWGARYQLTASVNDVTAPNIQDQFDFSLYSSNFMRLFDVHLDFSYYLDFTFTDVDFRLGSYRFYMDFPDDMIRLSWGEVSSNLLSPSGQSIGMRFDKSLAYAGSWRRNTVSHVEQMVLIEKTSEIEVFNEGQSIYKRTLEPGSYRLMDFILYTGANRILIRITPIDGSPAREIEFDVMYSGSLLAPGETYYGASFVFGRKVVSANREKSNNVVSIPLWGNRRIDYDWRDVVLSGYIRRGLSESFTLDATLALQNDPDVDINWRPNISFAAELTQASRFGTTRYNLNIDEKSDDNARFTIPVFDFRIGHQITTDISGLSTISLGASYETPEDWDFDNYNQLSANIGMAGSLGRVGWSLSGYGTVDFSDISDYTWSVSAGLSLTASRNVYLSASINVYDNRWINPTVSGRIGATIRFQSADLSANTGFDDISVRASYSDSHNSFSTTVRSYDPLNIHRYDWNAAYSYSGDYISAGINVNSYDTFDRIGLSANIATSTLFADGLFALSSYIPANFLLVRQYGALKGNDISIGAPGSSSFEHVPSTFGTALYKSIPVYSDRSLMIYSTGQSQFDATETVAVNLRSASRDGYVIKLNAEETYSASGIVILDDETLWANGSSPLYSVVITEEGEINTEQTDVYIFTDSDGRFVISGLAPGIYGFDVRHGSEWVLALFTVYDGGYPDLQLLGNPEPVTGYSSIPEPYGKVIVFPYERHITAEEFFALLYPDLTEAAV